MQLAADPIVVEIAGEAYELRPTLRAALRLTRKHGDYLAIYNALLADHVTVSNDVIREGSGYAEAAANYLTGIEVEGVRVMHMRLKLPLLRFVLQLAGGDDADDNHTSDADAGDPMPLADYHAALFRIGTGWLGWSPAETWNATPAEILAAQKGRSDLVSGILRSVFGDGPAETTPDFTPVPTEWNADGTDPNFDREGLAALRASMGKAA
jgi:hypothetical protein